MRESILCSILRNNSTGLALGILEKAIRENRDIKWIREQIKYYKRKGISYAACPDYGKLQADQSKANLKKIGKIPRGVQRYQCKTCGKTFTETKGTIFYRKHAEENEILEVLALLAEGNRISTLTRVKGIKEDTILSWLRDAARHADQLEAVLMKEYHLKRAQIDGLWSFVANKGEKKLSGNR